ncbi:MAG: DNA repair protein RecN [Actinobacteria bacterium]|nr:DNA repair protein RecN [Actinomycetota bacterium]
MAGVASKKTAASRTRLEEINIRGLGVIDQALVEFSPGLNVITGETGAGKTMLLTALSLLLGEKADSDLIRTGHERLSVSGIFSLTNSPSPILVEIIDRLGIDVSEDQIILSRNVAKDGKSRALISGATSTAANLETIGSELIEVHGQHGSLVLTKATKQRELLDISGGAEIANVLEKYQESLTTFIELKSKIKELRKALNDRDREIASLRELAGEYERIKPKEDEFLELDSLISRLESVEDLRLAATGAQQALTDEENGGLNSLHHLKRFLQSARGKDPHLDALHDRASDALFSLIDIGADLDRYIDGLSADPQALENALTRRSLLSTFVKRFGESSDKSVALSEAIDKARLSQQRIGDLTAGDDRIAELESELVRLRATLKEDAQTLSQKRSLQAKALELRVTDELHDLAMPKAKFEVKISSRNGENDDDFSPNGLDEVAIAENYPLGSYVFDEVDAGVGGKAALEVGRRLWKLSQSSQVIVVTHLAQVALWADNHIVIEKDISGAVTESTIRRITDHDREVEIARMLSGVEESEHAQEHARELLNLRITEKA